MKCPDCGQKLHGISPLGREEWVCDNYECPGNKGELYGNAEYYGRTQQEINKQKRKREPSDCVDPIKKEKST
jgi:hypothetical protein